MNNTISVDNTLNITENQNTTRKNSNFKEVSNIYPSNITKLLLHPKNRDSVSFLRNQAYGICRTRMSAEYIRYAFGNFKRGFVYYRNDRTPFAFCLWKINNKRDDKLVIYDSELHILLICGRDVDFKIVPYILDDLVKLCKENNINRISLYPANNELKEYYIKCGFEINRYSNNDNDLILNISKSRMKSMSRGRKTRKQIRSTST